MQAKRAAERGRLVPLGNSRGGKRVVARRKRMGSRQSSTAATGPLQQQQRCGEKVGRVWVMSCAELSCCWCLYAPELCGVQLRVERGHDSAVCGLPHSVTVVAGVVAPS
jgi:hypothetical protein